MLSIFKMASEITWRAPYSYAMMIALLSMSP